MLEKSASSRISGHPGHYRTLAGQSADGHGHPSIEGCPDVLSVRKRPGRKAKTSSVEAPHNRSITGAQSLRSLAENSGVSAAVVSTAISAVTATTKRCITCKTEKPAVDFPQHNGSRDGLRRTCRRCMITGRYKPYIVPPEKRARRKARESQPHWQAIHRAALARYANRNPVAQAAMRALNFALKAGKIVKSHTCQVKGCRSKKFIEAHHWSYNPAHWLDVLWCCAAHHRQGLGQGFIIPRKGILAHRGTIPEKPDSPTFTRQAA